MMEFLVARNSPLHELIQSVQELILLPRLLLIQKRRTGGLDAKKTILSSSTPGYSRRLM
jgi:hypothetical protein